MRRRDFMTGIVGSMAACPPAARAQQAGKLPTIGFLGATTPAGGGQLLAAFVQRLRELGWVDGRNVAIEVRWAEGRSERFAEIAAELVRLKVDVILTHNTPPVLAAKEATSVIPIVFASAGDPVGTGVVASLARPGGNVTGLSAGSPDVVGKRLELLREVMPGLRRLAILTSLSPHLVLEIGEVQRAARTLALGFATFEIRRIEDIEPAFETLKGGADALYVISDPVTVSNRVRINTLALGARLPTMHSVREPVEAGGLMSYGANWSDMFRRAADFVDKILRGAKPADIPVEQQTKFDLIINLTTAKVLGLKVPTTLLARADEVIEERRVKWEVTIKPSRRRLLHLAAAAAALPVVPRIARAQTYPTRPVRWLVGYPPGGGADTVTRILAHWLSERLSQQVIIENRPGASTNISAQAVINSPSRRSHGPRTMAAARNSSTGSRRDPASQARPDTGAVAGRTEDGRPAAGVPPDSFGTVTESDTLMLREMARGLDGDGVENFVANVQRRLDELEAGGFKSQRTKFAPPALLSWR